MTTSIGFVIQPGQPIPGDVTEISDCDDDAWTLRGERWTCEAMLESSLAPRFKGWSPDQLVTKHGPLTVTAVREQPAEPARKLIGPPHAHLDAPCTDACYEPAEQADASPLLDLVRQYGEESYQQGIAAGQRDEGSEDHYDAKARALHDRIAALVPQQPVQARDETGRLLWIHTCGFSTEAEASPLACGYCEQEPGPWLPLLVGGDPAPEPTPTVDLGEALDEAVGDYEAARAKLLEVVVERDQARAELKHHLDAVDRLAEERNEAVAERDSIKAEFDELASLVTVSVVDPLVLSLPEVPEGTEALVGVESGRRWDAYSADHWRSDDDIALTIGVLYRERSVRVELAPPPEPRTWSKLDPVPDDLRHVRGASGTVYDRTPGTFAFSGYRNGESVTRSLHALREEDGPLDEVTE